MSEIEGERSGHRPHCRRHHHPWQRGTARGSEEPGEREDHFRRDRWEHVLQGHQHRNSRITKAVHYGGSPSDHCLHQRGRRSGRSPAGAEGTEISSS